MRELEDKKIKNETCIFKLVYMLIPINFQDIRFTDYQQFKQGFNKMHLNQEVNDLKYVNIRRCGFSSPIIQDCV